MLDGGGVPTRDRAPFWPGRGAPAAKVWRSRECWAELEADPQGSGASRKDTG